MATDNLSILTRELIERALEVSAALADREGCRTAGIAGMRLLRRRQKRLLDLVGKLEWDLSYDYKVERTRD